MKKSTIVKTIALSIITIIVLFYIMNYMASQRLTTNFNPKFDIADVITIEHDSISEQAEILNKGNFIEYKCIYKDSCLNLIHLGIVDSLLNNVDDLLEVINSPIPYPRFYKLGVIYSPPCFVRNAPIAPFYNVYSLPASGVSNVQLYIKGKIRTKINESATIVKYKISAERIDIALNSSPEVELSYSLGMDGTMIDADLTFKVSHGNLYVVISTKAFDIRCLS